MGGRLHLVELWYVVEDGEKDDGEDVHVAPADLCTQVFGYWHKFDSLGVFDVNHFHLQTSEETFCSVLKKAHLISTRQQQVLSKNTTPNSFS